MNKATEERVYNLLSIMWAIIIIIALIISENGNKDVEKDSRVIEPITEEIETVTHTKLIQTDAGITTILNNCDLSELDLLAKVVMAEVGGNHCEYCERLVIDTVLNRVDDDRFANTISDVVIDPVAFETVKNGSIWKVTPSDEIYKLIISEIANRTCYDVLAFQLYDYHNFGYAVTRCHEAYYSGIN